MLLEERGPGSGRMQEVARTGDWASYQLRMVSGSCRLRCVQKRRPNPVTASMRSTTSSIVRMFLRVLTFGVAQTRLHRGDPPGISAQSAAIQSVHAPLRSGVAAWAGTQRSARKAGDLCGRSRHCLSTGTGRAGAAMHAQADDSDRTDRE